MDVSYTSPMMIKINQLKKRSTPVGRIKNFVSGCFKKIFSDDSQSRAQMFVGKIFFGIAVSAIFIYAFGAIVLSLPHWGSPEILQSWLVLPLKILGL